ncbi:MAG: hypothetical protein AVO35_02310 [Candidatus Aegiribacteria sp. MLS_C]|nr:MAG: hypothetical protein AVO35_02310 [Candidatus Aegiribacteria sp. MLS_C]
MMDPGNPDLVRFDPKTVLPSEDRVLARSGCPPSRRGGFGRDAGEALEQLSVLALPKALYVTRDDVEITGDGLKARGIVLESTSLARFMKRAEKVSVFLVTIGPAPEKECRGLQEKGLMSRAFFLDSAASCMVEEVSRALQKMLAERLPGLSATGRFAPGFGDFALSSQNRIMKLLDGQRAGVRLENDSYMLRPVKSGTGVIGWIRRSD